MKMKSLNFKVTSGFLLLVGLLIVAGSMSIYEFIQLGETVNELIDDNYKTIEGTKQMTESLEREDSGVLLLMLGKWNEGRRIIQSADSAFMLALNSVSNNITEQNEPEIIEKVRIDYAKFRELWKLPIVNTQKEGNLDWYFNRLHDAFNEVKGSVKVLEALNQNSLYHEASNMKLKAHRAIMPGIIAIISAIIFTLILNFFIIRFFISPIGRMAEAVKNYVGGVAPFDAGIRTNDEIKMLESEIKKLLLKHASK